MILLVYLLLTHASHYTCFRLCWLYSTQGFLTLDFLTLSVPSTSDQTKEWHRFDCVVLIQSSTVICSTPIFLLQHSPTNDIYTLPIQMRRIHRQNNGLVISLSPRLFHQAPKHLRSPFWLVPNLSGIVQHLRSSRTSTISNLNFV